ncbi:MAG: hypothetical protein AAB686_03810 [Patescibacteria group bacterium]
MFQITAADYPTAVPIPGAGNAPIQSGQGFINFAGQLLIWIAYLFWIAAVAFIFYAGFLYLTAGGDAEKVKKANQQLKWAVIGIIVGLFAYGLPYLLFNILSRGGGVYGGGVIF